jgi:hypothetical protein
MALAADAPLLAASSSFCATRLSKWGIEVDPDELPMLL